MLGETRSIRRTLSAVAPTRRAGLQWTRTDTPYATGTDRHGLSKRVQTDSGDTCVCLLPASILRVSLHAGRFAWPDVWGDSRFVPWHMAKKRETDGFPRPMRVNGLLRVESVLDGTDQLATLDGDAADQSVDGLTDGRLDGFARFVGRPVLHRIRVVCMIG